METETDNSLLDSLNNLQHLKNSPDPASNQTFKIPAANKIIELRENELILQLQQRAINRADALSTIITDQLANLSPPKAKSARKRIYRKLYQLAASVDQHGEPNYLAEHLVSVSQYAKLLAIDYIQRFPKASYDGYHPRKFADGIVVAATLHDIGKYCVTSELINSSKRYTAAEREIMKVHVECGRRILIFPGCEDFNTRVPMARNIAWGHHYQPNGKGYGGNPENPSLAAAIVRLVDEFDAGTSERSYKKALPFEQVIEEWIQPYQGTRFDARVAETFFEHLNEFKTLHDQLKVVRNPR